MSARQTAARAMKRQPKKPRKIRRQIFVFTSEEKKIVACVVAALALGVATKYYRDRHPQPPAPLTARQQFEIKRTAKANSARARSARGQRAAKQISSPTPGPTLEDEEEN